MAFFTDTHQDRGIAMSFFSGIASFFDRIADAQNRSVEVQQMQRLSDRELADIGISRENIVRYVYRDIYNI